MVTEPIKDIQECDLSKSDILLDKNGRKVLVQIGMEFFELKLYRPININKAFELKVVLDSDRYNVQLLKVGE